MMAKVRLALVVAMSENRCIGKDGTLPWHIRSDLKRFKEITHSKPVIMGSNTWDSLPRKPLPGRLNLVVSRDVRFEAEGGIACGSLFEALDIAREHAVEDGAPASIELEICCIGGANVFAQLLPRANRLYVTHVHATVDGDTFFPEIDPAVWAVVQEEDLPKGEHDDYACTLRTYDRK